MLIFAHVGIPLGIISLTQITIARLLRNRERINNNAVIDGIDVRHASEEINSKINSVRWLDYRWLLFGSLLPDILDKPLGTWLFRESLSNGRVFGHTLLFLLIIFGVGIYMRLFKNSLVLLSIAIGCFTHLCLDQMWLYQQTLLWPLHSFDFETKNINNWTQKVMQSLLNDPTVYIPEIIGFIFIVVFLCILIRRKQFGIFVKSGQIG